VWEEPSLPKSPAGKILRRTIKERCRRAGEVAVP
jgi:acyl-CoA synthetase (AMP-forming)/AMP-acid ligase II